jgi:hypothetical protein
LKEASFEKEDASTFYILILNSNQKFEQMIEQNDF